MLKVKVSFWGMCEGQMHFPGSDPDGASEFVLCLIFFWRVQDTETFYDLKKLLEESNAQVPSQLAHHEAAKTKPAAPGEQRRRDQIVFLS